MKKLIIIRHGDKKGGRLSDYGKGEMKGIAKVLKKYVGEAEVSLLSSNALWAVESTEALSREWDNLSFEKQEILFSNEYTDLDLEAVLALVKSHGKVDILVLVTHFEYAKYFPRFYGTNELGVEFVGDMTICNGVAVVIDCEQKTREFVSPW